MSPGNFDCSNPNLSRHLSLERFPPAVRVSQHVLGCFRYLIFCLTLPVIKWEKKVESFNAEIWREGISARPSPFETWPINSSFSGSLSVLALRSSLGGSEQYLCCWGFLESFAQCALRFLAPSSGSAVGLVLFSSGQSALCLPHLLA